MKATHLRFSIGALILALVLCLPSAWAQQQKKIRRQDIPAVTVEQMVDPTGCGDVFAAAFCYHFAHHRDVVTAADFANRIAAINVTYTGSERIDTISRIRKETEALK